ncbi:MAG: sel1 repeat family protein [Clostridia bacterium]|nr:sel1 repeat family protein [Clostridia bacterium]
MNKQEFEILLQKAQNGDANAMYQVALCYEDGIVVEYNLDEAIAWMNSSADLGNLQAVDWLMEYYFDDDSGVQSQS